MGTATTLLLHIFLMFVGARLAGELCERCGQPAVIGELLVGIVLGPFALGWIGIPSHEMIESYGGLPIATDALDSGYEILAQLGEPNRSRAAQGARSTVDAFPWVT